MPRRHEQIAKLREYGLSDYASRAYVALLQSGPTDARTLATVTGIPLAKTYPTLRQLQEKGLVEVTPASPRRYEALPFSRYVERLSRHHAERADALKGEIGFLEDLFPHVPHASVDGRGRVVITKGRRNAVEKWRAELRACRQSALILAADRFAERAHRLQPLLEALHRDGVRIRILARMDAQDLAVLETLAPYADIRDKAAVPKSAPNVSLSIFDESSALLVTIIPDDPSAMRGDDIAVHTTLAGSVQLLHGMLDHHWRTARTLRDALRARHA